MRLSNALSALLVTLTSFDSITAFPTESFELEARQSTQCYSGVYVISARGTFEPQNASLSDIMAQAIVDNIPGSARIQVQYPGNADPTSEYQGYANMKKMVEDYNTACPTSKIVLMGYSQGAYVVGDVVANTVPAWSISDTVSQQILTIIQFGDPGQVKGLGITTYQDPVCQASSFFPRSGSTLAQFSKYADRLLEFCNPGDFVCCSTGNNFNDHIGYFTGDRAQAIAGFVQSQLSS